MLFSKMQACGNDFIVLDEEGIGEATGKALLAQRLCDRHYGIGGDGLLILRRNMADKIDMEIYNADGSHAEICGNGIRIAAKYAWDHGWVDVEKLYVECDGGLKIAERVMENGQTEMVCVDMGIPLLESQGGDGTKWPLESACSRLPVKIVNGWKAFCVSMGNPHAVIILRQNDAWPTLAVGPMLEKAKEFPNGTNVEFVKVLDRSQISLRIWERGVGETLSCGSGACAAAAVCMQKGLTDDEITVTLLGGKLKVSRAPSTGRFFLTGPAITVFEGNV